MTCNNISSAFQNNHRARCLKFKSTFFFGCYAAMIGRFLLNFREYLSIQSSRHTHWTLNNRPILYPQTWLSKYQSICVISKKKEEPIYTPLEACNYAPLKLSYFLLVSGFSPFEYWVELRKFRLSPIVGLFTTSKQITQQPSDFTFLSIHHPILKHVTKWSLNTKYMIRISTVVCHLYGN